MTRILLLWLALCGLAKAESNLVITIPNVSREECLNAGATWNEPARECVAGIATGVSATREHVVRIPTGTPLSIYATDIGPDAIYATPAPAFQAQLDRIEALLLELKAREEDVLHAHDFPVCTRWSTGLCRPEELKP